MRIAPYNQRNLLRPTPSFKLRLPRKGLVHIIIGFPIQQTCHIVLMRESLEVMKLVLENTLVQIPAETYIERARLPMI